MIWPNSNCWSSDWASTTNPNICQEVSDTLWTVHSYASTSCEGSTKFDQFISGQAIFPNLFGLNYRFHLKRDLDSNAIQDVIGRANQTFILTGQGQWDKYLAMHLASFPHSTARSPGGKSGHAVLCYGCDNGGAQAYICMGWGSSFPDKWVDVNSLSEKTGIYVVSATAEKSDTVLETEALEVIKSQ